jgi:DNA polymerase-3 subunit epsilon
MKVVIFDTETTGLVKHSLTPLKDQPYIIELGTIVWDTVTDQTAERAWLMNPGVKLEAIITKITGLRDEDVVDEPPFSAYVDAIANTFFQANVMVAHNVEFDLAMLHNELKRCDRQQFPWPDTTMCTVRQYEHAFGHRPTLQQLYQHVLGKPLAQTHRALDDCRAVLEILQHDVNNFFPKEVRRNGKPNAARK